MRLAALLCVCYLVTGCTTLHVYGADGKPTSTHRFPGLVDIKFDATSGALGFIRSSYGIGASGEGLTIGYSRTAVVRITDPEVCQAVVLVETVEAAQHVQTVLSKMGVEGKGFCIETKGDKK